MISPLRAALRDRLNAAMRVRDRQTMGAIRSVLAALENAEAVPVEERGTAEATSDQVAGTAAGLGAGEAHRRVLSPDEERALIEREIAELRASSAELAAVGHPERSAELLRAAEIVEGALEG